MSLATATYSTPLVDHLLRKPTKNGASWVSRSLVTVTGGADDTYETGGIALSASSCGLSSISRIRVLASRSTTTATVVGGQSSIATPLLMLFVASTGAEVANAVDITDYVFILEVEGYAP